MRKGQISIDFLAIAVFAFIIFLEMFQVYFLESRSAGIIEGRASALRVGNIIARAINEVSKANGTSAVVTIPESLDTGDTYYLSIKATGRRVDVFWPVSTDNRSVGVAIMTSNVSVFNISKSSGSNQSTLNITNINGLVSISGGCGNGVCESWLSENCDTCSADCGCGAGTCCDQTCCDQTCCNCNTWYPGCGYYCWPILCAPVGCSGLCT